MTTVAEKKIPVDDGAVLSFPTARAQEPAAIATTDLGEAMRRQAAIGERYDQGEMTPADVDCVMGMLSGMLIKAKLEEAAS